VVHRQWLPLHHSTSVRNHILQSQSRETKFFRHETSHRKASYVALVTVNGIREGGKKTTTPKNKNKKQLGQLEFYSTLKTEKLLGQFGDFRDLWRSEVLRSMRSQTLKKTKNKKAF